MTKPRRVRARLTNFALKAAVASALLALPAACGDGGGETTVDPGAMGMDAEPTYTLEDITAARAAEVRCRAAWQPLLGHVNIEASAPRRIAWSGDSIIYGLGLGTVEESLIRALPAVEPGPPVTLTNAWYSNVWAEDARVFYTSVTPSLMSVPMEGGSPRLEVEVPEGADQRELTLTELTPEHLYWLDVVTNDDASYSATLNRVARSSGAPEVVAELDGPFLQLQRAAGGAMIAWSLARAALVESDGSVRNLVEDSATGEWVFGADESAVFVGSVLEDGAIWRVPIDGSERRLFLPARDFGVMRVWADGAGGWLVHGIEYPPTGEQRATLWTVSADGSSELLACDPLAQGALELSNPIFTQDAIYFAAQYSDMWQLVRVEREPPAQ